ncbi:MAG: hypothetical protein ACYTGQ_12100 [Planctomycetota bacterium]|jgi:hypothetical protein
MILNLFVFAVVGVMTYTWWKQGLFSAAIHLVLTVISGVLAFGLWDTVVYEGLIIVAPEYAWGVGLLIPFSIILLLFRTITDKLIPGELKITPTGNMIGGGACGFVSGVLIAGMLVIGLQMTGLPKLMGYTGWALSDQGEPGQGLTASDGSTASALILPVDAITAGFFANICDNAMSPLSSTRSYGQVHPKMHITASFYAQGEFGESRKAIRKPNLSIADDGKAYYRADSLPENLGKEMPLRAGEEIVVVGSTVLIQPRDIKGAGDADGIFRVKRPQVSLVYDMDGKADLIWPYGYIQNGEFIAIKQDYIYSGAKGSVTHYWVFVVPQGAKPYGIQVKNTLAVLPDAPTEGGVAAIDNLVTYQSSGEEVGFRVDKVVSTDDASVEPDISEEESKKIAFVSEALPFVMSVNQLGARGVEYDGSKKVILSGQASLEQEKGVGRANGITDWYRNKSARIVQVKMGANEPQSLLGKVMRVATASTQAPILRNANNDIHMPVGYVIQRGNRAQFFYSLQDSIRTLNQIPLGRTSADDMVFLLYQVAAPSKIIAFELGQDKQPLNLQVEPRPY